jgi:hypothetical protein
MKPSVGWLYREIMLRYRVRCEKVGCTKDGYDMFETLSLTDRLYSLFVSNASSTSYLSILLRNLQCHLKNAVKAKVTKSFSGNAVKVKVTKDHSGITVQKIKCVAIMYMAFYGYLARVLAINRHHTTL